MICKTPSRGTLSLAEVILVVTIDSEEDNWGYYRSGITVENVKEITRLQNLFDRYGIKPTYLVTYQVALCDRAVDILSEILSMGKCEIGAHLHPWNTPPLIESLDARHSMLKNLSYELQVAKLEIVTDQIKKAFNIKPQSFRAGRWGLGPETVDALIACDYRIDTSITPMTSWRTGGNAPIYSNTRLEPYWLPIKNGRAKSSYSSVLEVPVTIGFNRWLSKSLKKVYFWLQKDWLTPMHPLGLLHHTGLLRKIWLSPELSSTNDMITLSNTMIKHGKRILNLSFHSSTLLPGRTPFVKNKNELERFYFRLEKFLEYLNSTTNLVPLTLSEIRRLVESKGKPFASSCGFCK